MHILAVCALAFVFIFSIFTTAYAFDGPEIILKSSFVDSEGRVNVVGTVRNFASTPVQVVIGLGTGDGGTLQTPSYGRIIWPLTDSPFKFVLDKGANASDPFIMDVKEIEAPNYDSMLVLNYTSMAVGEERAFVGTIKNIGPFNMYNVSVFAAVHSPDHKSQLDTVRSNIIKVIKPGAELKFTAIPDSAIRSGVFYYSCAGLDFDAPIPTIDAGGGKFIPFNLSTLAAISSLRYENGTDSIVFGIRPYSPNGWPLSLQIPQFSQNQTVTVMLDGELQNASVGSDGKTVSIDFFVPQGDHVVQVQGVRNVTEFPFIIFVLVTLTTAAIFAARFNAASKIS